MSYISLPKWMDVNAGDLKRKEMKEKDECLSSLPDVMVTREFKEEGLVNSQLYRQSP